MAASEYPSLWSGIELNWENILSRTFYGTDIYTFELYPAARPEETAIVNGTLKSSTNTLSNPVITVLRQKNEADRYLVNPSDGRFALALSAKGNNTVVAMADGCLPRVVIGNAAKVSRDMASSDFILLPASLLGRYPIPLPRNTGNKSILPLQKEATAILDAYVDFMLLNPKIHIRIESTRIEEAQAIHQYLLSRQLRPERFEYKANSALAGPLFVITEM